FSRTPGRDHGLVHLGDCNYRACPAQSGEELGQKRVLDGLPGGGLVWGIRQGRVHARAQEPRYRFPSLLLADVVPSNVPADTPSGRGRETADRPESAVLL